MSASHSVKLLRNLTFAFLLAFNACALTAIWASNAYAQNAADMMNLFGGLMRGTIVEGARADWRKVRPPELACIEQELQKQGTSTAALTQQGVLPADARIAGIRAGCATAAISASPPPLAQIIRPVVAANPQPLSATPTFDCTKAKSGSGLILCSDQAGAKADWDINAAYWANMFSLPEANRDAFTRAHEDWVQSVNRTCRLLPEQSAYMSQQRQCVLTAFRKRTDAYRAPTKGDALAESKLSPEQHADIQNALITLGLLDGEADGEFGLVTRSAIKRFQAQIDEPESEFLTATQRNQLVKAAQAKPQEPQTAETAPPQPQSTTTQSPGAAPIPASASPSFTCNGHLLPTEAVICSDDGLASFDRQLAADYKSSFDSLPESQRTVMESAERAWLAERNGCGTNKSCISNAEQAKRDRGAAEEQWLLRNSGSRLFVGRCSCVRLMISELRRTRRIT